MRIQQSFCYGMYSKGRNIDQVLGAAAAIGYPAVEIHFRDETFDAFIAAAARHGLRVVSMCGHRTLTDGLNRRENHDRIEAELRESIDLAARHGIAGLICFSGNRNEGQSDAHALETTAAGLKRVVPHAEKHGINLNVELLNSKVDHPGYQCDGTAWGVAMVDRVGSERVKLLYDIYHMQVMEGDVIRTIRGAIRRIGHFHTAGNPGRNDLDDRQELNYSAICRAIAATGYSMYVGHEFIPHGDPIEALRTAFAICDQSAPEP